ncbi:hypothetical protein PVK06_031122 [Gossypium arboreum]|uniref:Uncharacterized protein n=1 Tax=Gossypium arboreum TaxID=29729 RepID=A0ABR0NQG0_GOSAR|nr:hypothetical protein PVK06_031122 [Gossypium arboreum]
MLQDCPFAISVWNQLLVSWTGTYNDSDLALWWSYDKYYHEGFGWASIELVSFIRSYMGGLSVLAMPGTIPGVLRTARWHASTAPLVKANFDAAYRGVTLFLLGGGGMRCPGVCAWRLY